MGNPRSRFSRHVMLATGLVGVVVLTVWSTLRREAPTVALDPSRVPSSTDSTGGRHAALTAQGSGPVRTTPSIDSRIDPVSGKSADPIPANPLREEWREVRRRELDGVWANIRGNPVVSAATFGDLNHFFWITIAPLQDARGEYEQPVEGVRTSMRPIGDGNIFSFRNRIYRFPRGAYPAFDTFYELWATIRPAPDAIPEVPPRNPSIPLGEALLGELEDLKLQAEAAITARTEPY